MAGTSKQAGDDDIKEVVDMLADDIQELVKEVHPFSTESCIFKVPVYGRSVNDACYTPKLISLGPLHRGEKKLESMEIYKVRYLGALLRASPSIVLQDLINCLRGLEERARNFYEDHSTLRFTSDEFVKLMLLDGCFIIKFILWRYTGSINNENDPIVFTPSLSPKIFEDILLLENQLPYFVLEELFNRINVAQRLTASSFSALVYHCLKPLLNVPSGAVVNLHQVKHFVDYILKHNRPYQANYHTPPFQPQKFSHPVKHCPYIPNCSLPSHASPTPESERRRVRDMPSATKLRQSGIKFRQGTSKCFLDIEFTKGVIKIPTLHLEGDTEQRFRNWIAMEQHDRNGPSNITDYMQFMDMLIDSPHDVALLRSRGIIDNWLGSDEDAVKLFNDMLKGVVTIVGESNYRQLMLDVNAHYYKRWNKWKAKLRRDYFQNPWAIISLIAAIILLICTLAQTVFSVFQFHSN